MAAALTWLKAETGRTVYAALTAAGAVLLVATYLYVSNHDSISGQVGVLVAGGVGALLMVGAGSAGLILVDMFDEWRKLDRIEAVLEGTPPERVEGSTPLHVPLFRTAVVIASAGLAVGAVFGVIGWSDASGADDADDIFRALGTGAIGLIIAGIALFASTVAAVRQVRLRGAELFAPWIVAVLGSDAPATNPARAIAPTTVGGAAPDRVVVGADLAHFHVPSCAVVAGREDYSVVSSSEVTPGVGACGICLGDLAATWMVDDAVEMAVRA